ncbi:hypothetical protein KIS4809_2391 [Bacillus sp. ZZV12-4809]|nr:hypothetical protein KIS4809_2391 [Bacillus sp. ZZV12-4809]
MVYFLYELTGRKFHFSIIFFITDPPLKDFFTFIPVPA